MTIAFPYGVTSKARMDRSRFQDGIAQGTIEFAAQPSANDTVTIGGTAVTFVANGAAGSQANIGANIDASIDAIAAVLNASADANLAKCKYTRIGAAIASGNIAFAANPADSDTVTINGVAVTFKAADPVGNQVRIGADADATVASLIDFLNKSTNTSIDVANYALGAPVAATGNITFAVNPTANDTITIAGTAIKFVANGATGNQVNIGADLATTLTALKAFLDASTDAGLKEATYTVDATKLYLTAAGTGASGNLVTIAASAATPSGATLAGGKTKLNVKFNVGGAAGNAFTLAASAATASGANLTGGSSKLLVLAKAPGAGGNAITLAASVATVSAANLAGGDSRRTKWNGRTASNRYEPVDRSRWAAREGAARWVWTPGSYYSS